MGFAIDKVSTHSIKLHLTESQGSTKNMTKSDQIYG